MKGELDREDIGELIISLTIIVVLFLAYSLTPLSTLIHEVGHQFTCLSAGGTYQTTGVVEGAHITNCKLPAGESFTAPEVYLISMAGIGIEAGIGLLLMFLGFFLASTLGVIGSMFLFSTAFSLYRGAYSFDLTQASEIVPGTAILQEPMVQILLMVVFAVFSFGFYIRMVKEKKKRDFPFNFDL